MDLLARHKNSVDGPKLATTFLEKYKADYQMIPESFWHDFEALSESTNVLKHVPKKAPVVKVEPAQSESKTRALVKEEPPVGATMAPTEAITKDEAAASSVPPRPPKRLKRA